MTRWNETCTLLRRSFTVDDEGVPCEGTERVEVFCNSYTISTQSWATARLADYTADEEIQVRTCDYSGEPDVIYRDRAFSVLHKMVQGDNTRLLLKEYHHDIGDEADGYPIPPDEEEPEETEEPEEHPNPEEDEDYFG